MNAPRIALRSAGRARRTAFTHTRRPQSTTSGSGSITAPSGGNHALVGGLAGGATAVTLGYAWYHFSGAKSIVNTASQTKRYYESATNKLKEQTPEPNQALEWLRETSLSYASFIPGGRKYVETAFKDLDAIREKHGDKVDSIVRDTYTEIRDTTKDQGLSIATAQQVWAIIEKRLSEVAELGVDASDTIFQNHPGLKDKVGGSIEDLKSMKDHYGPEVKEQVDKTWEQVRSVVSKGVNANTVNDIRGIIEEKTKLVRKLADQAFDKGLKQAKPYLDKSPKVKELVEENADALKNGDTNQLWQKIKDAAASGNTSDLEQFVKQTVNQSKSGSSGFDGSGLESILKKIPGAESIGPNMSKLVSIGQEHGEEAKDLLNSTMKEIEDVLRKKVSEAEELANKAKNK